MPAIRKANRPELALLRGKRTPQAMEGWIEAFAGGDPELARRYEVVLSLFRDGPRSGVHEKFSYLGQLSPATRAAYSFAITEFFEFLARLRKKIVPPHEVTRADAEAYAEWLANRPFSLEEEKLRDGDQKERLAIYETVKELGSAKARDIAAGVPRWLRDAHPDAEKPNQIAMAWLNAELGRMVLKDVLVREPTMEEIRKSFPRAGIDLFTVEYIPGEPMLLWDVFVYKLPEPKPVSQTTMALRLNALSSFWDALAEGDGASRPILNYNPWKLIKKRVTRGISQKRARAAEEQRADPAVIVRVIESLSGITLVEKRNAALVWFLLLTGARVSEAIQIRRARPPASEEHKWLGWLDTTTEPTTVVITRKGGKVMRLPYPTVALEALIEFHAELKRHIPPPNAHTRPGEKGFVNPDSPRWRYKLLFEEYDSPLFPPINFWGANSSQNYQEFKPNIRLSYGGTDYRQGLTRHGVLMILRRVGKKAGLSESEIKTLHAHALRHFAATAMGDQGKDMREIQSMLGHESITTTEKYMAKPESLVALSGQREILAHLEQIRRERGLEPPVKPSVPRPEEPKRPVIEVPGVPVPEAPVKPEKPVPRVPERAPAPEPVVPELPEFRETLPENILPEPPVVFEPVIRVHERPEQTLVAVADEPSPVEAKEIRDGISPGSPWWVYDALVTTPEEQREGKLEKPETIEWPRFGAAQRQLNPWLVKYYQHWPNRYGVGQSSLLVWFAKGQVVGPEAARKRGVPVGTVIIEIEDETGKKTHVPVAPIPVLAPVQIYPEATAAPGQDLLTKLESLERLYLTGDSSRGIQPSPTKYFGLHRWFAFMAYATLNLEVETKKKLTWVPFDSPAVLGKELRAQADQYVLDWFDKNAHTYKTAHRYFKELIAREEAVEFWDQIEPAAAEAVAISEPIPDWFAEPDPIRAIYDRDAKEWARFEQWIADLTGQKLTRQREQDREAQLEYAAEDLDSKVEQARQKLEQYYEILNLYYDAKLGERVEGELVTPPDKEMAKVYEAYLKGGGRFAKGKRIEKGILQELEGFGIPDPEELAKDPEFPAAHERRIEFILRKVFRKEEPEATDPNVFKSQLFSPENFRIDSRKKTISHTEEYRDQFAERFEGRDSECVMRRAARAMWEHAKRKGPFAAKAKERASQYALLYAVMLSYVAWIYPCPHEIEERVAERLKKRVVTDSDREAYFARLARGIRLRLLDDLIRRTTEPERKQYLEDMAGAIREQEEDETPLDDLSQQDIERLADLYHAGLFAETPPEMAIAEELGEESPFRVRRTRAEEYAERKAEEARKAEREEEVPQRRVERDIRGRRVVRYNANARARAVKYLANATEVMPSPLRMIAAMTIKSRS